MRRTNKKQVTLSDIAQASGVSLSAVSLSLSDKPGVSQATRERVIELARTMGYHFRTPPLPVPLRPIKTIGLLVGAGAPAVEAPRSDAPRADMPTFSTFSAYIVNAIQATCRQMELNLAWATLELDCDFRPRCIPALLETGAVDGFLIAGMPVGAEICQALDRRGLPVVLIEATCPAREYSAILYDNYHGGCDATEYLVEKGHRHIGCVGGHLLDYPSFRERRLGYLAALQAHHLPPYCADFGVYLARREAVMAAALDLLRHNPSISALVCATDDIAIAVIEALRLAGIRVPRDISVIGFDDVEMAECIEPALTTMRMNKHSMGRMAVQILLNQALQANQECVVSYFRPVLVERQSVIELKSECGI